MALLQDLRTRGATEIDLIVTDGHEGLLAAVSEVFAATPRQRWRLAQTAQCARRHPKTRAGGSPGRTSEHLGATNKTGGSDPTDSEHSPNMASAIGEAVRSLDEDEEHLLTLYAFPQPMHRHIQTTNTIESLFSNVRLRDFPD